MNTKQKEEDEIISSFPEIQLVDPKNNSILVFEVLKDRVGKCVGNNLGGILLCKTSDECLENISEKGIENICIVVESEFEFESMKEKLPKIKECVESHREENREVKMDSVVSHKEEFEEKLEKILAGANFQLRVGNVKDLLTRHDAKRPSFWLFPYYGEKHWIKIMKQIMKEIIWGSNGCS